jgi:tellurite resistance protein
MESRLQHLPISIFSIVLGLTGYVIATQRVFAYRGWTDTVPLALLVVSAVVYAALLVLYGLKIVRYRQAVSREFAHPVMLSFFPTTTISLLLLSITFLEVDMTVSWVLWVVGAALQFLLAVVVLSAWIRHTRFDIVHFSPAWFIPVVGNLIVPVAGMEHGAEDASWLFFAVGIVFATALFVIFLYRMFFHQPLHERHLPTLFIIIAPPAIGAISYIKLTQTYDSFARILYFLAVFFALFLVAHVRLFGRLRFYLSWWAYTFPLAALTIATFLVGKETASTAYLDAATALWVVVSVLVAGLAVRTLVAVGRNEICVAEVPAPAAGVDAGEPDAEVHVGGGDTDARAAGNVSA